MSRYPFLAVVRMGRRLQAAGPAAAGACCAAFSDRRRKGGIRGVI